MGESPEARLRGSGATTGLELELGTGGERNQPPATGTALATVRRAPIHTATLALSANQQIKHFGIYSLRAQQFTVEQ